MSTDTKTSKTFGENLERLIKERNLSARQLAKEIGVKPSSLHDWIGKNGKFPKNPEVYRLISEYFDISLNELLFGEPDKKAQTIEQLIDKQEVFSGVYEITLKKINLNVRDKS